MSAAGASGGAPQSPAKLSLQESGFLFPKLCHALPYQPQSLVSFWGEAETNGWSPVKPLLVAEKAQPRPPGRDSGTPSLHLCQGSIGGAGSQWGLSPPASSQRWARAEP